MGISEEKTEELTFGDRDMSLVHLMLLHEERGAATGELPFVDFIGKEGG
ncbi:hypothetical protein [Geobacter sp.]|nr:hypothetical protein [Geobacter sp.]